MIKIVCCGGVPCANVINKCLSSFVDQTVEGWELVAVLDPADYNICVNDNRIKVHFNSKKERCGTLNTLKAISILQPEDEDILIFMDGDDWLLDKYSLAKVSEMYKKHPDTLITHGSWETFPPRKHDRDPNGPNTGYIEAEFKNLRKSIWRGSALRTMKHKVFKLIKDKDLRNDNGEYFLGAERAIMFPAMEMAGFDRVKFIKEVILVYNVGYPRSKEDGRKECAKEFLQLTNRQPYERLP